MAIQDQCSGCRKYSQNTDICTETNQSPIYDSSSCQKYSSMARINLAKTDDGTKTDITRSIVAPLSVPLSSEVMQPSANTNSTPTGWKRFFSFKGRIGRKEYALTYLIYILYCLPMNIIDEDKINGFFAIVWLLLVLPMIWIMYAQGAKRCHDRGNSGWYQFIPFYRLWMFFAVGDNKPNEYGLPT